MDVGRSFSIGLIYYLLNYYDFLKMNLNILLILPVLTGAGILVVNKNAARLAALTGAFLQLLVSIFLLFKYFDARLLNPSDTFLFQSKITWFKNLHIEFYTGI